MTKTKYQLMKEAGSLLKETFSLIFYYLKPDADLEVIDREVGRFLADRKSVSAQRLVGFPFNMCSSLNYEVVQGYPDRVVSEHDLVSIDLTILYKGVYVDKAQTIAMPSADSIKVSLSNAVNFLVREVADKVTAGITLGRVGQYFEDYLRRYESFRTCHYFYGHGIGDSMHEEPMIPNYDNGSSQVLYDGQFITLEPIIYANPFRRLFFDHEWTITSDELSAHAENTIYVTDEGAEVLT